MQLESIGVTIVESAISCPREVGVNFATLWVMRRIALYSHDTLGLGHLRRCLKLADHIRLQFGAVEGLLLTGSPWHRLFPLPAGFRVAPLPSVIKTAADRYESRVAGADWRGLLEARRTEVSDRLAAFEPELFVVDNVPCGLEGEVLPALRQLRRNGCRTVLALRDVLDDLDTIRRQWAVAGAYEAVAELFDEIWVFGDAGDTATLVTGGPLESVATKVHSCGRIGHLRRHGQRKTPAITDDAPQPPVVLVTGGGGRDAAPLMRTYLDAVSTFRPLVTSHLVLGPDFPRQHRATLVADGERIRVDDFVPDLPQRFATSNVIVSMAGYNSVCEILAGGRPAVLVPRVTPRQEQLLRATRWSRQGRVRLIDPRELTPEALWEAVDQLLDAPPVAPLEFPGGHVAAARAANLLGVEAGP